MPTIHNPTITTYHFRAGGKRHMLPGNGRLQLTDEELAELRKEPAWERRLEQTEQGFRVRSHRGVARAFEEKIRALREERRREQREADSQRSLEKRVEGLENELTAERSQPAPEETAEKPRKAKR